jgi:hypothetical protein
MKLLLLLLALTSTFAQGAEIGASQSHIARKRVLWAWDLVGPALYSCLAGPEECGLTAKEKKIVGEIYSLHQANRNSQAIEFKSGAADPGFFDVGSGPHRIAVTGNSPGSAIYFNTDVIEPQGRNLALASMISILVHELGHHTGLTDTEEFVLDQLGNKVARIFERHAEGTTGEEFSNSATQVLVFNPLSSPESVKDWTDENTGSWPSVYATDGYRIFSLALSLEMLLDCAYGTTVRHVWLNNLHWRATDTFAATETHYCLAGGQKLKVTSSYFLHFEFTRAPDGSYRMSEDPAQQVIRIPLLEIESDQSFEGPLGDSLEPPKLSEALSAKASPAQILDGGEWQVEVGTGLDPAAFEDCTLLISSDEFVNSYNSGQKYTFESDRKKCQLRKGADGKLRIHASYHFPASTPNRRYYLRAIKLRPHDILKNYTYVLAPLRQAVQVRSSSPPPLKQIESIGLHSRGESAVAPAYGFVKYGLCQKYILDFKIPAGQSIIQAHATHTIRFHENKFSPITLRKRITKSFSNGWKLAEEKLPSGDWFYKFDLTFWEEFMSPEHTSLVEFRELTLLTQSLEEYRVVFPRNAFGLKAFWSFGMQCGN